MNSKLRHFPIIGDRQRSPRARATHKALLHNSQKNPAMKAEDHVQYFVGLHIPNIILSRNNVTLNDLIFYIFYFRITLNFSHTFDSVHLKYQHKKLRVIKANVSEILLLNITSVQDYKKYICPIR
jgi:hypothetical protein